ncbi:hypothetical protein GCM10011384_20990 [Psychrobacillus lasiicapitis]|nr:hypothetical protein GCM10011384_20990 [Psychrobacillus lasiicapitis]
MNHATKPELRGQNNPDWKILVLQVELGECANEWRGFNLFNYKGVAAWRRQRLNITVKKSS